jgi:phosphomethylpyrimidine synthase
MATLIKKTGRGEVPWQVKRIAAAERIEEEALGRSIAEGSVVIMQRGDCLTGIGRGLTTKVNANIGTSTNSVSLEDELSKARIAERYGADTISDLSMGGDINAIRMAIMGETTLPVTTVPMYQAVSEHGLKDVTEKDIMAVLTLQAGQGISSFVIHGVNQAMLREFKKKKRIMGVVSKGGSITSAFMLINRCENPFIDHFDRVLSICKRHDIVLSLGNTARSGCISDRRDRAQAEEIRQNVALADEAHEQGVQVIIEGAGGHIRSDRIGATIRRYKKRSCYPLFVAGPLPVDTSIGYDHIAGCAGAAIAASAGADYLCYITPSEHLGLPGPLSVKEGVISFKIAAHIGDTVRFGRTESDEKVARLRAALDREGQIRCAPDPDRARELTDRDSSCTMCGEFCALELMKNWLR